MRVVLVSGRVELGKQDGTPDPENIVATFECPYHLHRGDNVHARGGRYMVSEIHYLVTDDEVERIYKMICYVAYLGPSSL